MILWLQIASGFFAAFVCFIVAGIVIWDDWDTPRWVNFVTLAIICGTVVSLVMSWIAFLSQWVVK